MVKINGQTTSNAVDIPTLPVEASPDGATDYVMVYDDSAKKNIKVLLNNLPTGGGGETNTASSIGTGGVSIFDAKVGTDLQFKSINTGSTKVTVTNDVPNNNVDIDIVEANIVHQNLSGVGSNTHTQLDNHLADATLHFTEASIDHTTISNIGTNTHAQIDTHIASTSNPHSVVIADVSTLTTKGDLMGYSTVDTRLAVGTNGQVLSSDSTEASGLKWIASGGGGDPLTTKGDIFGFDTDAARLPVGTNGQHLVSDSVEATGLKWVDTTVGDITTGDTSITTDATNNTIIFTTNGSEKMKIKEWGNVGIGESFPDAKLHINQSSLTGGTEVLKLEQIDQDEPFIVIEGTESNDLLSSITDFTTPAGTVKFFKVQLDTGGGNVDYWIPLYSAPTS